MNRLKYLFSRSLLAYFWQEFLVRYRFKYVLPHVRETEVDGIRLDLSRLSLKVRNRILMGIYEVHEKRICQEFLRPEDAVLEIGGAIGFVGLFCQKKIGIRQYWVVEANPATLEILRANYRLNGLEPAAWNLALGAEKGALELDVTTDFWENSVIPRNGHDAGHQTIRVPSASLEDLVQQVRDKINVLIIDIEGAEQFIDLDQIPSEVDKIIIELHPAILGPQKTYDFVAGLIQRGFYVAQEENATFAFLKRPAAPRNETGRWQRQSAMSPRSLQPAG